MRHSARATSRVAVLAGLAWLCGCSVWPVNQDPAGMNYRRDANQIIAALQSYDRDKGAFPPSLAALTPTYLSVVPDVPGLQYHVADGSLDYDYIPSWPQLRPVHCESVGNTTDWKCDEHPATRPL